MFKKILAITLGLVMILGLAACSKNKTENDLDIIQLNEAMYNEDGYFTNFRALDYVTLNNLDNVKIDWADIEEQINEQLEFYRPQTTVEDRSIVDGDFVQISYVGYLDGKTFSGNTQNNIYVQVDAESGSYGYIEEHIANELLGHMPGDKFDVTIEFPKTYEENMVLSGKEVTFNVTIHNILEFGECEWNNEFVKEHFYDYLGITTTEEAEEIMLSDAIFNALYNDAKFSDTIPTEITDWLFQLNLDYLQQIATNNSMTVEEYLKLNNVESKEKLKENSMESYIYQAKVYLFCQALAEHFGYKVTDSDIKTYFTNPTNKTVDETTKQQMIDQYGLNYVKAMIMYNTIQEKLPDFVTVTINRSENNKDNNENTTVPDDTVPEETTTTEPKETVGEN